MAKLCRRHSIPLPDRGHWAKVAAGKASERAPLPPHDHDETIPRFREIDGNGAPLEASDAEGWVIPGVLRASPPSAPGVDSAALHAALAGLQTADALPREAPRAGAKRRMPAQGQPAVVPRPLAPAVAEPPAHAADRRKSGEGVAFDVRTAALQAELERIFVAAAEHQLHTAARRLLDDIAVRALDEEPAVAQSILAWVSAMRRGLEADDPVVRLMSTARRLSWLPPP